MRDLIYKTLFLVTVLTYLHVFVEVILTPQHWALVRLRDERRSPQIGAQVVWEPKCKVVALGAWFDGSRGRCDLAVAVTDAGVDVQWPTGSRHLKW